MPEKADVQPAPNNADASGEALLVPFAPIAERWKSLPLLALQSSAEVATGGEVQLLTLQAAFERERNSAAAAQLQVAALQEQLANLQEKQEEVLVLREQLADTEAHTRQTTGPAIAETEQKKLAEHALLKVIALQEELASLSAQVLKAKTTAESEKARAASALAQMEAAQRQLAVVALLQNERAAADSHVRPEDDRMVDRPPLNELRDAHPAERASKPPLLPGMNTASLIEQEKAPQRSIRSDKDKSEQAMAGKPRQALLNIEIKPPARPLSKSVSASARAPEPDMSRLTTPRQEPRNQSVRSVGKSQQRASQQRSLLAQDTKNRRDPGALSLPSDLLPDNRLW